MSDVRQHRRPLWLIAQDFIRELFALFGDPSAIAARHTLVRAQWRQLVQWLRVGASLIRWRTPTALLTSAYALHPAPPFPPRRLLPRPGAIFVSACG